MSLRDIFETVWNVNILPYVGGLILIWAVILIAGALLVRRINKGDTHVPKP